VLLADPGVRITVVNLSFFLCVGAHHQQELCQVWQQGHGRFNKEQPVPQLQPVQLEEVFGSQPAVAGATNNTGGRHRFELILLAPVLEQLDYLNGHHKPPTLNVLAVSTLVLIVNCSAEV
jgi:hypothetical protein